jgi:hypothetical protein
LLESKASRRIHGPPASEKLVAVVSAGRLTTSPRGAGSALKSFRASHDIFDRLAKSEPGNAGWQRDLSVSYNNIGDVLVAQGNLPEAPIGHPSLLWDRQPIAVGASCLAGLPIFFAAREAAGGISSHVLRVVFGMSKPKTVE